MRSVKESGEQIEVRHFMDDDYQITIGIDSELWPILQQIAIATAKRKGWLIGHGSSWDYLNLWVLGRLLHRPAKVEPWQWIEMAVVGE